MISRIAQLGTINFCVENVVPTETAHCFRNHKPWVNGDIKVLLNEKNRAFRGGARENVKERIQQGKVQEEDRTKTPAEQTKRCVEWHDEHH